MPCNSRNGKVNAGNIDIEGNHTRKNPKSSSSLLSFLEFSPSDIDNLTTIYITNISDTSAVRCDVDAGCKILEEIKQNSLQNSV